MSKVAEEYNHHKPENLGHLRSLCPSCRGPTDILCDALARLGLNETAISVNRAIWIVRGMHKAPNVLL